MYPAVTAECLCLHKRTFIHLYCRKKHKTVEKHHGLCEECEKLRDYAAMRVDKCPFMETKTFCSNCRVHCYKPQMREEIRNVMRFAGPRMLFYHPIMAIKVDHQIHDLLFFFPFVLHLLTLFYIFHLSRLNSDRLDFCKEIYIFKKDQQKNKNTPRQIAHHKKCTHQHCGCRKQNTQLCL